MSKILVAAAITAILCAAPAVAAEKSPPPAARTSVESTVSVAEGKTPAAKSPEASSVTERADDNGHGRWLLIWTAVASLAAVAAACIAGFQVGMFKKQLNEMAETTAIAKTEAEAAATTARLALMQHRAYVIPGPGESREIPGGMAITVTVRNVGQMPAVLTSVVATWCPTEEWEWPPTRDVFDKATRSGRVVVDVDVPLNANMEQHVPVGIATYDVRAPLHRKTIFHIRITYADVSRTMHYAECAHYLVAHGNTEALPGVYAKMWD